MASRSNLPLGKLEQLAAEAVAHIKIRYLAGSTPPIQQDLWNAIKSQIDVEVEKANSPQNNPPLLRRRSDGTIHPFSPVLAVMRVHDRRNRANGELVFEACWEPPPEHIATVNAAKERDAKRLAVGVVDSIRCSPSADSLQQILKRFEIGVQLDMRQSLEHLIDEALAAAADQVPGVSVLLNGGNYDGGPGLAA